MFKRIIMLMAVALGVSGCTNGYRVQVNGYSELSEPIAGNAALFVTIDPNAPNPIFARQIKANTETLLRGYGYTVADAPETADYRIRFQVGMKSETVMGYTPAYRPYFGATGGYPDALFRLFQAGAGDSEAESVVWVGEAVTSTERAELRETVGYLLIGCIEYLGVDTGQKVSITIRKDDPRLLDIADE